MKDKDEDANGIFSIFTGLDKILNAMVDDIQEKNNINGTFKPDGNKKPNDRYAYNFKIGSLDKDGFHDLKNFQEAFNGKENTDKTVTPVTDIFEEEERTVIVFELPGVEEEDIELDINRNTIALYAARGSFSYKKLVTLDYMPDRSSLKKSFHNAIYSIEIKKM